MDLLGEKTGVIGGENDTLQGEFKESFSFRVSGLINPILKEHIPPQEGIPIGYMQGENGKMHPINSGSVFFRSYYTNDGGYDIQRDKKVQLSPIDRQSVQSFNLQTSKNWQYLPQEVRDIFEGGEIILTSGKEDMYDCEGESTKELIQNVRSKIQSYIELSGESQFFLMQYVSVKNNISGGRTSTLVQCNKNGDIEPVVVNIDGREYVIELKGSGTGEGGFGGIHSRYDGTKGISGGARASQAFDEFENLLVLEKNSGYKIAGVVTFLGKGQFEQGYILRLSPTTIRAGFYGNKALPEHWNQEYIWKAYIHNIVFLVQGNFPRILDADSWHLENLAIYGDNAEFTDFCDQKALESKDFPNICLHIPFTQYFNFGTNIIHILQILKELGNQSEMFSYFCEVYEKFPGKKYSIPSELQASGDLQALLCWFVYVSVYFKRMETQYSPRKWISQISYNGEKKNGRIESYEEDLQYINGTLLKETFPKEIDKIITNSNFLRRNSLGVSVETFLYELRHTLINKPMDILFFLEENGTFINQVRHFFRVQKVEETELVNLFEILYEMFVIMLERVQWFLDEEIKIRATLLFGIHTGSIEMTMEQKEQFRNYVKKIKDCEDLIKSLKTNPGEFLLLFTKEEKLKEVFSFYI